MLKSLSKRQIISLVILAILLLAIPLILFLGRQQQILKSRAQVDQRLLFTDNTTSQNVLPGDPPATTTRNIGIKITHPVGTNLPPPPTPQNIFTIFVATNYLDRTLIVIPISGITATLIGPTGTKTAVTNSQGAATFSNLPAGNYTTSIPPGANYGGQLQPGDSHVYFNVDPLGYHPWDYYSPQNNMTVSFSILGHAAYNIPNLTPDSVTVSYIFEN